MYIGKAKNLRNRLSSHLRPTQLSHRFQAVMDHLVSIETVVTRSETEALLLENNLIKEHKPKYNINLRDDKSYPYIHLDDSHEFPKLGFYRGNRKEPGKFFGPFSSASAVRSTLSQLQKTFPVRQCRDSFFRHRSRPCLQYQINRCSGPCVRLIDRESYMEDVAQVSDFLSGKSQKLQQFLVSRMDELSKNLEFESAAKYRDRIAGVQRLRESQHVDGSDSDTDIIAIEKKDGIACVQMVFIRRGRNIDYRSYFPKITIEVDEVEILAEFFPRYYLSHTSPSLILIDRNFPDIELISSALREQNGKRIEIRCPKRGPKRKLLDLARMNAQDAIRRRSMDKQTFEHQLNALARTLNMEDVPNRIECFDISHTAGDKTVASSVVFDRNGPVKSEYRRLNISGVEPSNDYGAMRQALHRRYRKAKDMDTVLPDLVLIDGGTGQLGVAMEVFDELQITDVQLAAISKGPKRKPGEEQLWIPDETTPVGMAPEALFMFQKIRDEAHRFALLGHRVRLTKAHSGSALEEIPGVGAKRRSILLKHFGGLQGVERAGIEELSAVPGISSSLAVKIFYSFHDSG